MKISGVRGADPATDSDGGSADTKGGGHAGAVALILAAIVLGATFLLLSPYAQGLASGQSSIVSWFDAVLGGRNETASNLSWTKNLSLYSPLIENGSALVTYPGDYPALSTYALSLINQDRATSDLAAVAYASLDVGQQHADSMLRYGYFSHWDTQGFKPYMRYTLLGGTGAVEENVAYISYPGTHFSSTGAVEAGIKALEYDMMYNDSVCCDNGHRANILNPTHTSVAIGVAYNATTLYFVEDFESYYVNMTFNVSSSYAVSMTGTPVAQVTSPTEILVTYDPPPTAETPYQLNNGPNDYSPGNVTGGVLPPCSIFCSSFGEGITVYASKWVFSQTQVDIVFQLSDFVEKYGTGVYTVYLLIGPDTSSAITSISVFVK